MPFMFILFSNLLLPFKSSGGNPPEEVKVHVSNWFKYRKDGTPGREITLNFSEKITGNTNVDVRWREKNETHRWNFSEPVEELSFLLPERAGLEKECMVSIALENDAFSWKQPVSIPPGRYWKVMIYPHSHVDIGYTNTHANVELIHTRNIKNGLKLAKDTKDYPEKARYLWNPEVIWPFDMLYNKSGPDQKKKLVQGVKKGYLHLDAGYVHLNTSISGDEELLEFLRQAERYEEITGKKSETLVQVDIPGMTWGLVKLAAHLEIKYIFAFNNGSDRVGWSVKQNFKPFWWADRSGENKVLFLQPGSYTPGAVVKGKNYWPSMAGQTDSSKLIQIVKTNHPRENFVDNYLNRMLPELQQSGDYPYDLFAMSWAMADNTPIDADLPEAVKSWNEEYAYPELQIASATGIMKAFEKKYGDQLPVLKGDFTEYWTDGTGTAAKQTAMNRTSKERLVTAETLWTLLNPGKAAPREAFDQAWKNIFMGSEHTWCYMDPALEPINSTILKEKFSFFDNSDAQSSALLKRSTATVSREKSRTFAVFNHLSWARSGLVKIPANQSENFHSVSGESGKTILSQKLSTGELVFRAENVPAFGSKKYRLHRKKVRADQNLAGKNELKNNLIHLRINPQTGDIASFQFDGMEWVNQKTPSGLNSFRYLPGDDAPENALKPQNVRISIKENGPLLATLKVESDAAGCRSLVRELTIFQGEPTVAIKNIVDKIATQEKEGIHFGFPFGIDQPRLVADIPWGIMEVEKEQLKGANRNWIALKRWLNIAGSERSITWCPLDAPVFQVGNITANILGGASRSEQWIRELEPSGTIYSWALNNHWYTNFQLSQGGKLIFRYLLKPHRQNHSLTQSNRFAMEHYQPLTAVPANPGFEAGQLLTIEGSPAVFATILKTTADGKSANLRLRSLSAKDEIIRLNWSERTPSELFSLNLDTNQPIKKIKKEVIVPAHDFVTLKIIW